VNDSDFCCSSAHVHPHVVLGYDTRASSPSLAEEVLVGIEAVHGLCIRLGLISTPQLHFAVKHLNDSSCVGSLGDTPEPNLDQIYIHRFASRFANGLRSLISKKGEQAGCDLINLNVDCAHGVGSLALAKLSDHLASSACPLHLHLFNTDVDKRELLNKDCGADFVKLFSKAPKIHDALSAIPCSPNDRWATVDGDADRLLYFHHTPASSGIDGDVPTDAAAAGDSSRIILLDGDRIACLFASFLTSILRTSDGGHSLTVGVIQTAYANAGSTKYLRDHLHVTVSFVPTGVKHLHHAAQAFDFGIYFEVGCA
ncbi:phosphoacetylglucosamine mutase, partial [Paragonimus westermani]